MRDYLDAALWSAALLSILYFGDLILWEVGCVGLLYIAQSGITVGRYAQSLTIG